MATLLQSYLKPEAEILSKGIGHPGRRMLYRPDALWKLEDRWVCVEIEKNPSRNKIDGKLKKADAALQDLKAGWEPSKDKLKLRPALVSIKSDGLKILIAIPKRSRDYLDSAFFENIQSTAAKLGIEISVFLVDIESKDVLPVALRHHY
jgi:hypothetical protein